MTLAARAVSPDPALLDQRVHFHGVSWEDYERLVEVRGDESHVRLTYIEGTLEIMAPSNSHEHQKTRFARLLEAWSEEMGVDLDGVGSWTVRNKLARRGLEPDECYFVGPFRPEAEVPDFAIEVVWTSGGLDKLPVYAGLGVREVWFWQDGSLSFYTLRSGRYEQIPRSELVPALDPELINKLMNADCSQAQAVRDLRATLRAERGA